MKNIIKDNRIVSDYTYAVRNLTFLCSIYPNIPNTTCSSMDEEEYDYMCMVACDLLRYQVETCPEDEKYYFKNLYKDYKNGNDIIEHHICRYHKDFLHYLQTIKAIKLPNNVKSK